MRISFNYIKIKNSSVAGRKLLDQVDDVLFCEVVKCIEVVVFYRILFSFTHFRQLNRFFSEMLDRRVDKNPSYPAFKGTLGPETVQIFKDLHKPVLKQILRVFGIISIPKAHCVHLSCKTVVKLLLHLPVALDTSLD